jgi:hypothetical protein
MSYAESRKRYCDIIFKKYTQGDTNTKPFKIEDIELFEKIQSISLPFELKYYLTHYGRTFGQKRSKNLDALYIIHHVDLTKIFRTVPNLNLDVIDPFTNYYFPLNKFDIIYEFSEPCTDFLEIPKDSIYGKDITHFVNCFKEGKHADLYYEKEMELYQLDPTRIDKITNVTHLFFNRQYNSCKIDDIFNIKSFKFQELSRYWYNKGLFDEHLDITSIKLTDGSQHYNPDYKIMFTYLNSDLSNPFKYKDIKKFNLDRAFTSYYDEKNKVVEMGNTMCDLNSYMYVSGPYSGKIIGIIFEEVKKYKVSYEKWYVFSTFSEYILYLIQKSPF